MSIFNFNNQGTLLVSPKTTYSGSDLPPEDLHVINLTKGDMTIDRSNANIPEHGLVIASGSTSSFSPEVGGGSIFTLCNATSSELDNILQVDKTTGSVNINGTLSVGGSGYSNLPKWATNIEKTAAWQIKVTYNDGTSTLHNFTQPIYTVNAKLRRIVANSETIIEITASEAPLNGRFYIDGIDTTVHGNRSNAFLIYPNLEESFYGSELWCEPFRKEHIIRVYNSSGSILKEYPVSSGVSGEYMRVGRYPIITNGQITRW